MANTLRWKTATDRWTALWRQRRVAAASAMAMAIAATATVVAVGTAAPALAATAGQSYDLTTSDYCTTAAGRVTPTLNTNLISNAMPTTSTVTPRSKFFPGATKSTTSYTDHNGNAVTTTDYVDANTDLVLKGGSNIPDPGAITLPNCWLSTSSLAATDPAEEIAGAQAPVSGYTGHIAALTNPASDLYGGNSANGGAAAGTTTTLSQVVDLSSITGVGGHVFQLAAALGGYLDQADNAIVQAIWQDANGTAIATSTVGPGLPEDRNGISGSEAYAATGTVPAGTAKVRVLVTMTMGGSGNNNASASAPYLAISDSASANHTTFATGESVYTASCSASGDAVTPRLDQNLVANSGAENVATIAPTVAASTAPGSGSAKVTGSFVIPDCWTVPSGYFAHGVVPISATDRTAVAYAKGSTLPDGSTASAAIAAAANVTAATASASGYNRVGDPNSNDGVANASNYHVFYGGNKMVNGSIGTFTQTVDLSHLTTDGTTPAAAAGQAYQLKAWLGGYQAQVDNASTKVDFEDASGNVLATSQVGPVSYTSRSNYGTPNGADATMLLPVSTTGTVPDGTTKAVVTISAAAYSSGNDDGMVDDVTLILGDSAADAATSQNYDATSSAYCTTSTGLSTPARDANLISNAGAEYSVSTARLGANGDTAVAVPACWVAASALPQPNAVAESSAQTLAAYPQIGYTGTSTRVFYGGSNPVSGIAGVATTATQTISLSSLDAVDGSDYKLAGWLGGYATQDDNAVVTASFQDASGKTLSLGSIGPVKQAARGGVSELLQQAWYGKVPAGATKVVVKITITAVASGAQNNGVADNLSLVIGTTAAPVGPILQTLPYDASTGGDVAVDPTTGLPLPPAGGLYRPAGVSALNDTAYGSNTGDNLIAALAEGSSTTLAGSLTGFGDNGDEGQAVDATLYQPAGSAIDEAGDLYIADTGDNVIRKITPDGIIHRVAGTGTAGGAGSVITATSTATSVNLNHPVSVALDADDNLYIADTYANRVLKMTPSGAISIYAGTGASGYTGDGAAAAQAKLAMPTGVAVDAEGGVYIADAANNVVRRVDAGTGIITTVAGDYATDQALSDCLGGYSGDGGPATSARLNDPQSVAVDGAGDLFIADTFNNVIREVTPDGIITTVVNSASQGLAGGESSGQAPAASKLNTPYATAVDPTTGVLYIADTRNNAIAEVTGTAQATVAGTAGAGPIEPAEQIAITGSNRAAQLCAESVTYSISYDLGAVDATDTGNPSTYTNKTPDFTLVNPTRPGYTFAGWTGTELTGANTDVTIAQWTNGDLAYTATWTINTATVSFDLGGQGGAVAPQTVPLGGVAVKPADPSASGSVFAGWFTDAALTTAFDFTQPIASDTVLYAKWTVAEAIVPVQAPTPTATSGTACTFVADQAALTTATAKLSSARSALAKTTSSLAKATSTVAKDKAALKKHKATAKTVAAATKKVTALKKSLATQKKTVAADQKIADSAARVIAADEANVACLPQVHQAALAAAQAKLTADKAALVKDSSALRSDKKALAKDKIALAKAKSKSSKASAKKKVTAESKKVAAMTKTVASDTKRISADQKALTAAQAAVAADSTK